MTNQKTYKRRKIAYVKNKEKPQNTTQKNNNLKKVRCSPKDKKELNDFTCYTDNNLYKM